MLERARNRELSCVRILSVEFLQAFVEMRDPPLDVADQIGQLGLGKVGLFAEAVIAERAEELRAVAHHSPLADVPLCHPPVGVEG
jgi:hypothetical protein